VTPPPSWAKLINFIPDLNLPSLIQILHDGNNTHKQGGMIFSNSYAMPYALCTMLFLGWQSFP
jgi:hypothetical protein